MSPAELVADLVEFLAEPTIRLWNRVRNKLRG